MSISASLNNALSGLTASARSAQLVSNNVANAMTEGYGRREIDLSSRSLAGLGAGVQVDGVTRVVDMGIVRDRRLADAGLALSEGRGAFYEKLERIVGIPDDPASLSARHAAFEASLIEAATRPDSQVRLSAVLTAAHTLSDGLNTASDRIQETRVEADRDIARQVDTLNRSLQQVQELNNDISRLNGSGQDVSALLDQRQLLIDGISRIVPVREMPATDGKVALYTTGGAVILDSTAREIGFVPTQTITADMTLESGALSGLTIDGKDVRTTGSYAPLAGGSLAAAFDVRDRLAPEAQAGVDAIARDLIERFADPAVDPTLADDAPGLFTDAGRSFDPVTESGLGGRIAVNALADPAAGGSLSLLRDGLGAAAPGPVGDATRLLAMSDGLTSRRMVSTGNAAGQAHTAATLVADLASYATFERAVADRGTSFAAAQRETLHGLEAASGVDTDQEMQKLLLIERSYAANARVIQTIDSLLEALMRI